MLRMIKIAALIWSIKNGHGGVEFLIENGADVDTKGFEGMNSLHLLAMVLKKILSGFC